MECVRPPRQPGAKQNCLSHPKDQCYDTAKGEIGDLAKSLADLGGAGRSPDAY